MVVDTSALVAIFLLEPEAERFAHAILEAPRAAISAANLLEAGIILDGRIGHQDSSFQSVGFPGWLAYVTIAAELLGGTLLALGVYARWVALALVPILLGALQVHLGNGWVFSAEGGGWEYPAFLATASLVQALLGDGAYALRPAERRLATA